MQVNIIPKATFLFKYRLPEWAEKEFEPNGTMENLSKFKLTTDTFTKEMSRLRIGFLIKEMFEHFAQKINGTLQPNRSLFIYSAHEITIANVLNGLGMFEVSSSCSYMSDIFLNGVFGIESYLKNGRKKCSRTCRIITKNHILTLTSIEIFSLTASHSIIRFESTF